MSAGLDDLYFRQLLVGRDIAHRDPVALAMRNFVYLLGDRATNEAVVLDPAYAPGEIVTVLETEGMQLVGALASHFHADHIGGEIGGYEIAGCEALLELADVPIHVMRAEVPWIERSIGALSGSLVAHDPGDTIAVGRFSITLVHTPGHTPGSQCLFVDGALLTGDTLFIDGCGRTDLPGGDPDELYASLQQRLAGIPAETMIYAGHDYSPVPIATLGELRRTNPVLIPRDIDDWRRRFGA